MRMSNAGGLWVRGARSWARAAPSARVPLRACAWRSVSSSPVLLKKHPFSRWSSTELRPSEQWMPNTKRPYIVGDADAPVVTEAAAGVCTAILNRPGRLNALNLPMIDLLTPLIHEWENNDSVNAIVLRGAGHKAFCAGGDILAVVKAAQAQPRTHDPAEFFFREYQLNHLIGSCSTPVVSLLDGITMGGGVGLSIHGKFRVATDNTLFAMPETGIGLFPDVGATHKLSRLHHPNMDRYLCLTGARLSGPECYALGLCTHYVPRVRLPYLVEQLSTLTDEPSSANVGLILEEAANPVDDSDVPIAQHLHEIETLFSAPSVGGIVHALKTSGSPFATKCLKAIQRCSPTSLHVTLRQLQLAKKMTLEQCLQQDFNIASTFVAGTKSEFYEGVRALLVDKSNDPKWDPAAIDAVTPELVDEFFVLRHPLQFIPTRVDWEDAERRSFEGSWGRP